MGPDRAIAEAGALLPLWKRLEKGGLGIPKEKLKVFTDVLFKIHGGTRQSFRRGGRLRPVIERACASLIMWYLLRIQKKEMLHVQKMLQDAWRTAFYDDPAAAQNALPEWGAAIRRDFDKQNLHLTSQSAHGGHVPIIAAIKDLYKLVETQSGILQQLKNAQEAHEKHTITVQTEVVQLKGALGAVETEIENVNTTLHAMTKFFTTGPPQPHSDYFAPQSPFAPPPFAPPSPFGQPPASPSPFMSPRRLPPSAPTTAAMTAATPYAASRQTATLEASAAALSPNAPIIEARLAEPGRERTLVPNASATLNVPEFVITKRTTAAECFYASVRLNSGNPPTELSPQNTHRVKKINAAFGAMALDAEKNLLKTSLTDLERMPAIAILLKNLNNLVAKFYAYEYDKAETPAPPRILKKDPNGKYADLNVSAIEAMESRIKKFNPTFGVSKTDCQSFRHKVEHQGLRVRVFKKK